MYPESKQQKLKALIEHFRPRRILSIGPAGKELFADYLAHQPDCLLDEVLTAPEVEQLEQAGRHDLAFISHVLEKMPKAAAEQLLARLRDVHCHRLIIVVPIGTDWPQHTSFWQRNDLLALGFTLVGEFEHDGRPVDIFAFDIASYKTTPDWLNSKYWANPELFGKYWW